jgi:glycosyltransferase involved in cell wall biosynthesis
MAFKRGFPFMVCFVGIMGDEDGVLELLDVIRHIIGELGRQDILFVLIGDGATRSRALADLAAEGLDRFVDMPGMIRDDLRLREYMSTADVFVSPEPLTPMNTRSTFIKIGEYMAMGKPIVAFDLSETRYTAQDAACYVSPGDIRGFGQAIVDLLDDPEHRRKIGIKGRQRILSELGWEHQSQYLFQAYAIARQSA